MKIKECREKQAKYDPIAWSKCNIYHQKYPNDEIYTSETYTSYTSEIPRIGLQHIFMLDLWHQVQKGDCYEVSYENSKTSTGS